MADDPTQSPTTETGGDDGGTVDYKALWEQAQADAEKWKALSRQNEKRAKSNESAAVDLDEISKRLAAIEDENAQLKTAAEHRKLVAKVAKDTGVPETIVATLAATDEKALAEAATAIANAYKTPGGAPKVPEGGKFPNDKQESGDDADRREFVRQIFGKND